MGFLSGPTPKQEAVHKPLNQTFAISLPPPLTGSGCRLPRQLGHGVPNFRVPVLWAGICKIGVLQGPEQLTMVLIDLEYQKPQMYLNMISV